MKAAWFDMIDSMRKMEPSAMRKLRKLELKSKSKDKGYVAVKKLDIIRLKVKINDFISAILGAGHSWLMFIESVNYAFNYDNMQNVLKPSTYPPSPLISNALRIAGIIFTAILLFTIIRHYQFRLMIWKVQDNKVPYTSIWQVKSYRLPLIVELIVCSIFLPPSVNKLFVAKVE